MSATAVLNLSRAGFTDAQVAALAEYFDLQMATKDDIAHLHVEVERIRADLGRDIEQLRADLGRDIEQLRADLGRDIALSRSDVDLKLSGMELKISEAKGETIKWVAGLLIAQGAAIVALVKFLPGIGH